jgi:hypothetical protein
LTVTVLFLWGAVSDERTGLSFVYAAGPRLVAFLGSESRGTRGHILLSQIDCLVSSQSIPKSKSKSKLLYDWRFTANQFVLASSPLRLMTRIFFFLPPT